MIAAAMMAATITIKVTFICFFINAPPIQAVSSAIYIKFTKKTPSLQHMHE